MPERTVNAYTNELYSVGVDPINEEFIPVTTTTASYPLVESDTTTTVIMEQTDLDFGFQDFVEILRRNRERNNIKKEKDIPSYKEDPNNKTIPW